MRLIAFVLVIFSFFSPSIGSWSFIGMAVLFETYALFLNLSKAKVKNNDKKYTNDEVEIIERYHIFFRYPMASRMLSPLFSAIQLSAFVLVPWLLLNGLFIQAILIGINYFVAQQFAVILNPQFFLHDNIDKGKIKDPIAKLQFTRDMHTIDSALKKMYAPS